MKGILWIWEADTGKLIDSRKPERGSGPGKLPPRIAWQPGGGLLAYGGGSDQVTVYDTGERKVVARIPVQRLKSLAWSPTGNRLAMVAAGRIRIWEAAQGTVAEISGLSPTIVSWSPDGSQLVVAVYKQRVLVVNVSDGNVTKELAGHSQPITCVAWSPDGKRIASGGGDDLIIRIWDAEIGKQLCILHGHTKTVLSLAWSPDGTRLLAGGKDRMILWDATKAYEAEAQLRQAAR